MGSLLKLGTPVGRWWCCGGVVLWTLQVEFRCCSQSEASTDAASGTTASDTANGRRGAAAGKRKAGGAGAGTAASTRPKSAVANAQPVAQFASIHERSLCQCGETAVFGLSRAASPAQQLLAHDTTP